MQVKRLKAREALASVSGLLEQYRQSVLAAAFRGDLTAEWRASHPDAEPATVLLDRIRQERRRRWEAAELARMKSPPRDDRWKAKYQEPEAVDESDLPELPEGWCWTRFGDVISELRNGLSAKPEFEPPGHPILRINAVRPGQVLFEDLRFLRGDADPTYFLRDGDLLFTRYNGSLELLGVCGVVRGLADRTFLYPDKLMRVRLDGKEILPEYVEAFFAAPDVRRRLVKKAKSSAGQQGISGADIKEQLLALPPMAEQIEIVRLIQKTASVRELVAGMVSQSLSDLSQLDQTVLAKAFRGELVPQDPDDEPASDLLERIRAERQAEGKGRPARSRQGRLGGLD